MLIDIGSIKFITRCKPKWYHNLGIPRTVISLCGYHHIYKIIYRDEVCKEKKAKCIYTKINLLLLSVPL